LLGTANPGPIRGQVELLGALDAALAASSGVLLFIGEAGSGKTRLLAEAARRLADRGAPLLGGSASEIGADVPFGPFQEAFFARVREMGGSIGENPFAAFEPTPGGAMEKDKLRLFRAVERSIETLAAGGPVLLAIDDLHWADESSLHLFHHLGRATRTMPLFLAATVREEDVVQGGPLFALLVSLGRERLAARFRVERLGRDASADLIADFSGAPPRRTSRRASSRWPAATPSSPRSFPTLSTNRARFSRRVSSRSSARGSIGSAGTWSGSCAPRQ
jgi:hypothetical protein